MDDVEKLAELTEEPKVAPHAAKSLDLEEEKKLKPEVKKLLKMFEEAGYQTHRGTNSYLLANIIVDYTQRILLERANTMTYLNYWETQDIAVLAPLAFERYRIYNMRSSGTIYQAVNGGPVGQSYQGSVRISKNEFMQGQPLLVNLGHPNRITRPLPLKVAYEDLLAGSSLVLSSKEQPAKDFGEPDFLESFMDEDGKYIEQDYLILPDEEGQAVLIPTNYYLERIKKVDYPVGTNARVLVFARKTDISPDLTPIRDAIEIDCDYLRFITTELMAKFAILNRMSVESFIKFLKLRYFTEAKVQHNKIYADLPQEKLGEVLDFAVRNVIAPVGQEWEVAEMGKARVVVASWSDAKDSLEIKERILEIISYLKSSVGRVLDPHEIEPMVNYYVDEFYRERYGFKGVKVKEEDGVYPYVVFEDTNNRNNRNTHNSNEEHLHEYHEYTELHEHHEHHDHHHDHPDGEHDEDCGCDTAQIEYEMNEAREGFYLVEYLTEAEFEDSKSCCGAP